jgi:RNA polymerase sigma-70 factor (ECF subfamily)
MSLDIAQLEVHRPAVMGHCYRMLGSAFDAEDAAQETLVRAWKSVDRFEARASVRTWLYRIATNVCLDAIGDRSRRFSPIEEGEAGHVDDELVVKPRTHWVEPIADVKAIPGDANPYEQAALRQSIRFAFVAALQHLPPRQRAALLLADVLGWSAAEIASALDMSVAAVNSALQRARATLSDLGSKAESTPLTEAETALVDRYVDAFTRYDIDDLVSLLKKDATLSMPPYAFWLQGPESIRTWMLGRGSGCRGSRLVPLEACGERVFGQYRRRVEGDGYDAWAVLMVRTDGDEILNVTSFLDVDKLFPMFNLPLRLNPR